MRRIGSHTTEEGNPSIGMLQQTAWMRRGVRCGAPIMCRWITGRHGVGVARPPQRVGEQVHALPRSECGELQEQVEGVRGGVSVRVGNSIG